MPSRYPPVSGFITINKRSLFRLRFGSSKQHLVIVIPPFAEEMNRCRHLLSTVMRMLAAKGCCCFMLDNFGTGDSEGDLDSATTAIWRADLQQLLAELAADGFERVSFIAVRFGALQLLDLLNQSPLILQPGQLILWQPLFDTNKFWQQFVRIKVAEAMAAGTKTSQAELEQRLDNGQSIEIAGYPISPAFYQSIQHMNATLSAALSQYKLSWFESSPLDSIAPPVGKMLQQLQQITPVNFVQLKAKPYWHTAELATADELITLTVQQLSKGNT